MADLFSDTVAAVRDLLLVDPGISQTIGNRIVDDPEANIAFPYVQFGRIEYVPDDTHDTEGEIVQIGLVVHSRPTLGRDEAARICGMIKRALHWSEALIVPDYTVSDVVVQTWYVARSKDKRTIEGRLAFEVHLDRD